MDIFENADKIPVGYSGHCYVEKDGAQYWILNKDSSCSYRLHREDGPATVYDNGSWVWTRYDKLHRIGGPACKIKTDNGIEYEYEYWIDGQKYTEEQYWNHPLIVEYKFKSILEN